MLDAQRVTGVGAAALASAVPGTALRGGTSGSQQQQQQQQGVEDEGAAGTGIRAFPELQSFTTLAKLWQFYAEGDGTRPSLMSLEANPDDPRHLWRRGQHARKRWHEIKNFVAAVTQEQGKQTGSQLVTPPQVVAQFDAHREECGRSFGRSCSVPQYVKGKMWEKM